ncbi:MAG: peptidoglycan DD-metalloendopeptidase family protein [Marmoricola sp.]|nr:peptidoglycan DD-metalloendopeptidase family protein [Marmoricola sp.]
MRLLTILVSAALSVSVAVLSTPPTTAATHAASPLPRPMRDGAWPLWPKPALVRGFEPPRTAFGRGHRGVDLLGHTRQAVHTSLAGRVTHAGTLAGRGVVVVDHGDVRTTYEPVTARVHVGDVLARGAVIGTLQRAASHCFPRACLHWGLRRGTAYLDPLVLVGAGRVRLLPLYDGGTATGPPPGGSPEVSGPPPPANVPVAHHLPRPV